MEDVLHWIFQKLNRRRKCRKTLKLIIHVTTFNTFSHLSSLHHIQTPNKDTEEPENAEETSDNDSVTSDTIDNEDKADIESADEDDDANDTVLTVIDTVEGETENEVVVAKTINVNGNETKTAKGGQGEIQVKSVPVRLIFISFVTRPCMLFYVRASLYINSQLYFLESDGNSSSWTIDSLSLRSVKAFHAIAKSSFDTTSTSVSADLSRLLPVTVSHRTDVLLNAEGASRFLFSRITGRFRLLLRRHRL